MHRISIAEIGGRGAFVSDPRYFSGRSPQPSRDPLADAYDRGFAEGERAARDRAEGERRALEAQRQAIELAFVRFDERSAAQLRERLNATVLTICQDIAGSIALDPDVLTGRVNAAASLLRRKQDARIIRLHPDDIALVEGRIDPAISLQPDASLARGSLRVDEEDGGVEDGPEQWRERLSEALGECSL